MQRCIVPSASLLPARALALRALVSSSPVMMRVANPVFCWNHCKETMRHFPTSRQCGVPSHSGHGAATVDTALPQSFAVLSATTGLGRILRRVDPLPRCAAAPPQPFRAPVSHMHTGAKTNRQVGDVSTAKQSAAAGQHSPHATSWWRAGGGQGKRNYSGRGGINDFWDPNTMVRTMVYVCSMYVCTCFFWPMQCRCGEPLMHDG